MLSPHQPRAVRVAHRAAQRRVGTITMLIAGVIWYLDKIVGS